MRILVFVLVFTSYGFRSYSSASGVEYVFSGEVSTVFRRPYGHEIPSSAVVTGTFIYDPASQATFHSSVCDCIAYRHQHPQGFRVTLGDLVASADEYVIQIYNDVPFGISQLPSDIFSVLYSSDHAYGIEAPLVVDGEPKPVGYLEMILVDTTSELFSDPTLPPTIDFNDFDKTSPSFFSDSPLGLPSVLFGIESLLTSLPGDYNADSRIDENDYNRWRGSFGSSVDLHADGNGDGVINAADYVVWRDNMRGTGARSEPLAVPEPTLASLLFSLGWFILTRARSA